MDAGSPSYKGFRYPAEIIAHCVWLYHRFPLSFREVEELMLARGVIVSSGRSASGAPIQDPRTRPGCAAESPGPVTSGTWTMCS